MGEGGVSAGDEEPPPTESANTVGSRGCHAGGDAPPGASVESTATTGLPGGEIRDGSEEAERRRRESRSSSEEESNVGGGEGVRT